MPRQSITLTRPNDDWLKKQVDSQEYSSKSDVINDLIRRTRQEYEGHDVIRAKLVRAEESGLSSRDPVRIRDDIKAQLSGDTSVCPKD